MTEHHQIFMRVVSVVVAQSFSDGIAIGYVLPVLWMTLWFHAMRPVGPNQARRHVSTRFARCRYQSDVRQLYLIARNRFIWYVQQFTYNNS